MKRSWSAAFALVAVLALVSACGGSDDIAASGDASGDQSADAKEAGLVDKRDAAPDAIGNEGSADRSDAQSDGDAGDAEVEDAAPDPCADAGVPPSTLACTGLYADFTSKEVSANALAYAPSTPLWSDGAEKQRWLSLPPDTKIDISNPNEWTFPVGTKLFKEFRVGGKRVETRLFQKVKTNFWVYATYAWNEDDSQAAINFGGPVPVGDGGVWNIPTNDDCNECHRGRQDRILGFEQVSLGLSGAQGLTLAGLTEKGLVTPAPASVSLTIGDDGTGLSSLALAWIHVNCGVTCHNANPSSAGSGAGMLLRLDPAQLNGSAPNPSTWDVLRTTLGVPAVSGSVAGQPRIRPHDPATSVIYRLISQRGVLQMPPIASRVVDSADVAVIAAWIRAMSSDGGAPPADSGIPIHDGGFPFPDSGFPFPDSGFPFPDSGFPLPDSGAHFPDGAADGAEEEAAIPDAATVDGEDAAEEEDATGE